MLGTAQVDICVDNARYTVRALIDSASEATFISKRLQKQLFLPTAVVNTKVIGLNGSLTATSTQTCSIVLGSQREKHIKINADAYIVTNLTGDLAYDSYTSQIKSEFSDITLADNHAPHKSSQVDLLLGGDLYPKIMCEGQRWDK